jgi:acetyltransferase
MAMVSSAEHLDGILAGGPAARIVRLRDGRVVALRVASSEDAAAVQQFVRGLSERSRRNRFFAPLRDLSPDQLQRVTRSHPPDDLALVGEIMTEDGEARIVAMAQYAACEPLDAEFAVVVDDAWQRQGLATQLVCVLGEQAARAGLTTLSGFVLPDNWPMLEFLARLDCELVTDTDPNLIRAVMRTRRRSDGAPSHAAAGSSRFCMDGVGI